MRLATIDLGTNTVRLLIADVERGAGRWRAVHTDQRVTRLGEGLARSGRLADAPARRTAAAVTEYVARARRANAERIAIVATSAVREAANGREFAAGLEQATGEHVSIIRGDEEAALTLSGVLAGLGSRDRAEPALVFDIGGGSTEYILARDGAAVLATSLRLGVVDLTERYPFPGVVVWPRFAALQAEVAQRLGAELPAGIRSAATTSLIGTAGTATTLAALDLGLVTYQPDRVQGHVVTRARVEAQLARLGALTVEQRAALPCLEPGRADLIIGGIAIVLATMDLLAAPGMIVSDWGLREGLLVKLSR
jgi:exopolyphosphatase / guanosine-5'-triphosphate,3'-diphosphate pyrophosphatase